MIIRVDTTRIPKRMWGKFKEYMSGVCAQIVTLSPIFISFRVDHVVKGNCVLNTSNINFNYSIVH